jgi:hypothetical protein
MYTAVATSEQQDVDADAVRIVEYVQMGPAGMPPTWVHPLPTHRPIVRGRAVVAEVVCRAVPPAQVR